MDITNYNLSQISLVNSSSNSTKVTSKSANNQNVKKFFWPRINILLSLKNWINHIEIKNSSLAHFLCKLIPTQCPFQRDIKILGHTLVSIPPLCKLNPIYEELMFLRFRAISYLTDICGEDVSKYC